MDIIRDKLDKLYANCEFAVNVHKNANHDFAEAEKTVIFYQGMLAGCMMMLTHLLPSDIYEKYETYTNELAVNMYGLLEKTYKGE